MRYICKTTSSRFSLKTLKYVYTLNPFCQPYCTKIYIFYNISTLQKAYPSVKPPKERTKQYFFTKKLSILINFLPNFIENILSWFKFWILRWSTALIGMTNYIFMDSCMSHWSFAAIIMILTVYPNQLWPNVFPYPTSTKCVKIMDLGNLLELY